MVRRIGEGNCAFMMSRRITENTAYVLVYDKPELFKETWMLVTFTLFSCSFSVTS